MTQYKFRIASESSSINNVNRVTNMIPIDTYLTSEVTISSSIGVSVERSNCNYIGRGSNLASSSKILALVGAHCNARLV